MKKPTQTQIKQWKAEHGEIHQIDIPLDDKGTIATAYVKKPDLTIIAASAKYAETDPIKSGLIMLNSCWIDGDKAIMENDEAKLSAIRELGKLFKVRVSTIKKL
jgi:hypothetical protein